MGPALFHSLVASIVSIAPMILPASLIGGAKTLRIGASLALVLWLSRKSPALTV